MEQNITIFFIIEVIGTIAFASSGAMVAIGQELDLLGVIVLGVTTAVGGGMLRDLLLGNVPPGLFFHPVYVLVAFLTVLVLFLLVRLNQHVLEAPYITIYEKMMNIVDAVGLAAFTVTGVDTAVLAGYGDYWFLTVFLGVLTGVGGGLLRDIMAGNIPFILKKHVYACASIAGAVCYVLMNTCMDMDLSMIISACLIFVIRMLATKYCWNLPSAKRKNK